MTKLSLTDISDMTLIDKSTLSKYLRGDIEIKLSKAEEVERATGLPVKIFTSVELQEKYLVKVYRRIGV